MRARGFWGLVCCLMLAVAAQAQLVPETIPAGTRLLGWAAILLSIGWAYGRWWWWKEKTRAGAWHEGLERDKRT